MKEVALIYKDRDNQTAIKFIEDSIYSVLGDTIHITNYYLDSLMQNQKIIADAYVVRSQEMLISIAGHVENYSKVTVLNRSFRKDTLENVFNIPAGKTVLVVNDTPTSSVQTVFILYDAGVNHLNLIPYDVTNTSDEKYAEIDTAIVIKKLEYLVPPHISKICVIQNREVAFETIVHLIRILGINSVEIQSRLMKKANDEVDRLGTFPQTFFTSTLKDKMMKAVVDESLRAMVLVDSNFRIHYVNEKAYKLFKRKSGDIFLTDFDLSGRIKSEESIIDEIFTVGGTSYLVEKETFYLSKEKIGSLLIFQDENVVRTTASTLSHRLAETGFFAKYTFSDIIHRSESMKAVIEKAKRFALSEYTVLIQGDSGTGKELIAQSIHNYSERKRNPFVAINCASLPETLLESELFGYEPGSFTGATKTGKVGLFEKANHGTLFLDEIGDISPKLQSSLLRALQEKQIMRIGSEKIIDVDVRIIAATNADLMKKSLNGEFRGDLLYRLNGFTIHLEPLRCRRDDVLPLFEYFVGKEMTTLSPDDKQRLVSHSWPGNVRELENVASYFKLMGVLPEYLKDVAPGEYGDAVAPEKESASDHDIVLKIIAESTIHGSGIGRGQILKTLGTRNIRIGEGVLKRILRELEDEGFTKASLGRGGTMITDRGREYLSEISK